ncbi:ABC-F family ATP-binding cassette domain-containing protein [Heliorestis acidaminivorans]|uniref:ABC-F family ATP-binding cassette domain-containing protein n=1 Tax=Heliorestis acidaminivorans TaxID=553427 RepID=A0A6I0EZ26_9FIRM|nr:ABC-F family ATP-binding cassette domain-containing protein [Heliorestis acidaminivorans]KAB2951856.1 ABC-F family ATP-binding cassette domain-containing protein [Heliorestis acidaminivorans]
MSNKIIVQAKKLALSYGSKSIFEDISFIIHENDKIGLVGPNGAGKTSLFKVMTDEEEATSGDLFWSNQVQIGYVSQLNQLPEGQDLFQVAMSELSDILQLRESIANLEHKMENWEEQTEQAEQGLEKLMEEYAEKVEEYEKCEGYGAEARVRSVLKGLGFSEEDYQQPVEVFSGGQKRRLALARLLLRQQDLIILDEPTNHLDLKAVEWLEDYLRDYTGAVLIISHDRYFLDKVCKRIFHLENGAMEEYPGNYSRFLQLREERMMARQKAYAKDQAEIAKMEEYIRRYKAGVKAKQARGRETLLNRRKRIEKPQEGQSLKDLKFIPHTASAEQVLITHDLAVAYPNKVLFRDLNLTVRKGECVAILGRNGVGKTSLFRVLLGQLEPLTGDIVLGVRVKPAYYAQEQEELQSKQTVLEAIREMRPMTEEDARTLLGRFLFRGEDVFKTVGVLSGGEKSRLIFARLFLMGANFLLLDEPTNHLDIEAKEALEEALAEYEGTVMVISHDRYFLDRLADRILELEEGTFTTYLGNYTDFRRKKDDQAQAKTEALAMQALMSQRKESLQIPTEPVKEKKNNKISNPWKREEAIQKRELEINRLEERIEELTRLLGEETTYQDGEKAKAYAEEFEQAQKNLALAYEEWESLMEND